MRDKFWNFLQTNPFYWINQIPVEPKNSSIERLKFVIQNRCDKVIIELRLLQFWSEIILVI